MNTRLIITTIAIYATLAMVIFLIVSNQTTTLIQASVYPRVLTINDVLYFSDSTANASTHVWEFGNGDKSNRQKGTYKFNQQGKYIIRLTINNSLNDTFLVVVKKPTIEYIKDTVITIFAEKTGVVGQKVHFKTVGDNIEWCEWYFGESKKIDAREQETFHAYNAIGTYEVKLITNLNPRKPIIHHIKISPAYKIVDNAVINAAKAVPPKPAEKSAGGGGNKEDNFQQYIQNIANGKDFNTNYKYILDNYLCGNAHIPVLSNGKAAGDFYSYCQGLQINPGATIDLIIVGTDAKKCINKLTIKQH